MRNQEQPFSSLQDQNWPIKTGTQDYAYSQIQSPPYSQKLIQTKQQFRHKYLALQIFPMVVQTLILILIAFKEGEAALSCPNGTTTCTVSLSNFTLNKVKPLPNPFKGFVPYATSDSTTRNAFPASMENGYFAMNELMTGPSTFNLTILEYYIATIHSRGRQAIVRVFADYPAHYSGRQVFIPDYLVSTVSLCSYSTYGGGKSPNYDDANLINAMIALINKLGSIYDGDNRIAVFQSGFLGHWAEHHTEPPCNFANTTTQTTIFNAFKAAFTKTRSMIRYPDVKGTISTASLGMGYHDDSFAQDTLTAHPWFFYARMISAGAINQWKQYPIGGELRPQFWTCIFGENITSSCAAATAVDSEMIPEDLTTCINTVHFSWIWAYGLFRNAKELGPGGYDRALAAAGNMGYSFNLISSTLILTQSGGNWWLSATILIRNDGVAPFYYDLSLNLVVQNTSYILNSNNSLAYLLPTASANLTYSNIPVTPPISSIYLKFVSNDTTLPIKFAVDQISANGLMYIDGQLHDDLNHPSSSKLGVIIGASVGAMVALGVVVGVMLWKKKTALNTDLMTTQHLEEPSLPD